MAARATYGGSFVSHKSHPRRCRCCDGVWPNSSIYAILQRSIHGLKHIASPWRYISDYGIGTNYWKEHTNQETGNHYKWDWPKSQFSMPDDSATVVWLRNLKVGNVYLFNYLQNTLKKLSFWKWEIRKLENVIFPSSAEPCRILQNSALVPQNSADHLGENHEILRISAEFRRMVFVPQNYSAELQNVIIFCRSLRNWANLFCGIVRKCLVPQNSSAELFIINPFCGILQNQLVRFCRILWNSAD